MVPTWSQKIHSLEMCLRPFRFSVENFSALAGLEVKLGQTWSQHGPYVVPKNKKIYGDGTETIWIQC